MTGFGIIVALGLTVLGYVILYQIIKAAVRNGYIEACDHLIRYGKRDLKKELQEIIKEGVEEALDEYSEKKKEGDVK